MINTHVRFLLQPRSRDCKFAEDPGNEVVSSFFTRENLFLLMGNVKSRCGPLSNPTDKSCQTVIVQECGKCEA